MDAAFGNPVFMAVSLMLCLFQRKFYYLRYAVTIFLSIVSTTHVMPMMERKTVIA
jgi:hypothetical protein